MKTVKLSSMLDSVGSASSNVIELDRLPLIYVTEKSHCRLVDRSVPATCDSTIRILFYRECDRRGRKLLYDSQTITRRPLDISSNPNQKFVGNRSRRGSSNSSIDGSADKYLPASNEFIEIRSGFGYKCLDECNDVKDIGELVFGTVALAFKGHSSKFHKLSNPSRLLFSCTFPGPRVIKSIANREYSLEESVNSLSASMADHISRTETGYSSLGKGSHRTFGGDSNQGLSVLFSEDDSGLSAPSSPFSTYGSLLSPPGTPMGTPRSSSGGSLNNSGSLNSLQKRFLRNVATSLESLAYSNLEKSVEEKPCRPTNQVKLGLAAILECGDKPTGYISEDWWLEHFNIVETCLIKLKLSFIDAYLHRSAFISLSYQSVERFQLELSDMLTGPRLVQPLWLTLSCCEDTSEREKLYGKLSGSLEYLLNRCDTKPTNFFISRLLTAVLTNHLGWVTTISPDETFHRSSISADRSDLIKDECCALPTYNAIWGQLSELTGAIGHPSKISKTLLMGKDETLLEHLLILLSYVIRCSQIVKRSFMPDSKSINDSSATLKSPPSCMSLSEHFGDTDFCSQSPASQQSTNIFELSQVLTSSVDLEPKEDQYISNDNMNNIIRPKVSIKDPCADDTNKFKIYLETPESEVVPMPSFDKPISCKSNEASEKGFMHIDAAVLPIEETGRYSIAESYFGHIFNHYSSVFTLHATIQTTNYEREILHDMLSSIHNPILDTHVSEVLTIVANCDTWDVELLSCSNEKSRDYNTFPVMMSPLVSQMTDCLVALIDALDPVELGQTFDSLLREIYLKSHILASFLLERTRTLNQCSGFRGNSLFNLNDISNKLSVDINDLPLLLAIASTHTPEVTKMFGLTYK